MEALFIRLAPLTCTVIRVPDFWPNETGQTAPSLDFRCSHFYATPGSYHVWAGHDETYRHLQSPDSLLDWRMRDCQVHGGKIVLGPPDDGFFEDENENEEEDEPASGCKLAPMRRYPLSAAPRTETAGPT